jgi:hypothetical protein
MRPIAILLCVIVAGCSDTFTENYSTLEEARNDNIFLRGWLPDILPASAHSLRVSGDVDINTAEGEFLIPPPGIDAMTEKLPRVTPTEGIPEALSARIGQRISDGYIGRGYAKANYSWVFLCSKERQRCEYYGWPER